MSDETKIVFVYVAKYLIKYPLIPCVCLYSIISQHHHYKWHCTFFEGVILLGSVNEPHFYF